MPPRSHLNVMERVFNLLELMTTLGFLLPQEDLYVCTLVNRQWHDTFIPILWHTIDDKTGSWSDILRYYDDYTCHYGFDKQWLHDIFRKYGHHIRHLSAEWAPIIVAANDSGACTNLLSFKTNNVDKKITDRQNGPPSPTSPNFYSSCGFLTPPSTLSMNHFNSLPFTTALSASAYYTSLTSTPLTTSPFFLDRAPQSARETAKRRRGVKQVIDSNNAHKLLQQQLAFHPEHHQPFFGLVSCTMVNVFCVPDLSIMSIHDYEAPSKTVQDWEVHQHIWLLVRSNLRSLRSLVLDKGINFKIPMSKCEFFYTTLGQFQNLTELDTPQHWISLPRLLDAVPSLQRLTTLGQMDFRAIAEEEQQRRRQQQAQYQPRWPNFRGLKYGPIVVNNELLWLLLCFSDLEDLEVLWTYCYEHLRHGQEFNTSETYSEIDPSSWLDMNVILLETTRQQPLKLKRLHLKLSQNADPLLPVLLPYLPSLTELILPHLDRNIANALVTHCPGLQIFRICNGPYDYFHRPSKWDLNWTPDLNIASILLANCRNLRVFEGSEHMIEIETLYNQPPWVCGSKLEVLRVQFGGFEKLDDDEQLVLETTSLQFQELVFTGHEGDNKNKNNNNTGDVDEDKDVGDKIDRDIRMTVLREKYERSKSQHTLFFKTLAQFHNLRILDLGTRSKSVDYHPPVTTDEQQGQQQQPIDEADHHVIVVPGTPSLTLEYGLSHLFTLQNLRVLNFEAVDHQLEKKDVIWMATHLEGLRHVYGLHIPEFRDYPRSYQACLDYRRTMLRTEFEKHKAIVRHDHERM